MQKAAVVFAVAFVVLVVAAFLCRRAKPQRNASAETYADFMSPRLHIVTYDTQVDSGRRRVLESSAARAGADLTVLGRGAEWRGFMDKFRAMAAYVKSLPQDDIVMFVDAYDVAIMGSAREIVTKFKRKGRRIVFAAEHWYSAQNPRDRAMYDARGRGHPHRYLNSGTYVGYVADISALMGQLERLAQELGSTDDQTVLSAWLVRHWDSDAWCMDYASDIMYVFNGAETDRQVAYENNRLVVGGTARPSVVHCAGINFPGWKGMCNDIMRATKTEEF